MATIIGRNIYIKPNGGSFIKHNDEPIPLDGFNYNISDVVSIGEDFQLKSTYVFEDLSESVDSEIKNLKLDFPKVLRPLTDISAESVYWATPQKSSDWPEIPTTKDNFILYGTVHANVADGAIYWGEFDSYEGDTLFGFVELGVIRQGAQAETPWLYRTGDAQEPIGIKYHIHDTGNFVDGELVQQTKLITTSGGALHTATYTDRGFVLGIDGDEMHTGYDRTHINDLGKYIAIHLGRTSNIGGYACVSQSDNGIDGWTRVVKPVDQTVGMPEGGSFISIQMVQFKYNGTNYAFINYLDPDGLNYLSIATVDNYGLPTSLVKKIIHYPELNDVSGKIEGDIAYLLIKGLNEENDPESFYKYHLLNEITPVSNLKEGIVNGNSLQLLFNDYGSKNKADQYEVYVDGVFHSNINKSGDYIFDLDLNTEYDIQIKTVDLFENQKSDFSNTLTVSTGGYIEQFQDVLAEISTQPSTTEGSRLNSIMEKFVIKGIYDDLDYFKYGELQEAGLEELTTVDWIRPSGLPKLTNPDPSKIPSFTLNKGWKASSDQHYRSGFIPATDAVKMTKADHGLFFKLFDTPQTFSSANHIVGARVGNDKEQFYVSNAANNSLVGRLFADGGEEPNMPINQTDFNGHYHIADVEDTSQRFYEDQLIQTHNSNGSTGGLTSVELAILGFNSNGTWSGNSNGMGMGYIGLGKNMKKHRTEIYNILNP